MNKFKHANWFLGVVWIKYFVGQGERNSINLFTKQKFNLNILNKYKKLASKMRERKCKRQGNTYIVKLKWSQKIDKQESERRDLCGMKNVNVSSLGEMLNMRDDRVVT